MACSLYIPIRINWGRLRQSYRGGSFVTQPALLFLGVPLQSTLAIDTAAALGTEAGILSETRKKVFENKKLVVIMAIPLFLGGILGTWLLLNISPEVIKYIMVTSVILVLLHSYFSKNKPKSKSVSKASYAILFFFLFLVSVYSNFIGLGEGTFGRIAVMSVLGLSFIQSQGIKSTATMPARFYSLIVTAIAGLIVWPYLITMWFSGFLAGKYATRFVKKVPDIYMRIALTAISIGFVIYLLVFY